MDDRDAPDDPVEYMVWLRRRREGLVRRNYKRIIDLEKESTALLVNALESIGGHLWHLRLLRLWPARTSSST